MLRIVCLVGLGVMAAPVSAGETTTFEAVAVNGFLDSQKNAFCIELAVKGVDGNRLVCDDATDKAFMEKLFQSGKTGEPCLVTGKLDGNALVVTDVAPKK